MGRTRVLAASAASARPLVPALPTHPLFFQIQRLQCPNLLKRCPPALLNVLGVPPRVQTSCRERASSSYFWVLLPSLARFVGQCNYCHRQKKRCAPLRSTGPPYDVCGRCEPAEIPCVRTPNGRPVASPARKLAGTLPTFLARSSADLVPGASRRRSPTSSSSSVVDLFFNKMNTDLDLSPATKFILEDVFPLQSPSPLCLLPIAFLLTTTLLSTLRPILVR